MLTNIQRGRLVAAFRIAMDGNPSKNKEIQNTSITLQDGNRISPATVRGVMEAQIHNGTWFKEVEKYLGENPDVTFQDCLNNIEKSGGTRFFPPCQ